MKLDPVFVQVLTERTRAQAIACEPAIKLDPALAQLVRLRVPIFSGMMLASLVGQKPDIGRA